MRTVDPSVTTDQLVRCDVCGRSELCTPEDLLSYTLGRWPTCCAFVMTYYKAAVFSAPDNLADTKQEQPALNSDTALTAPVLSADAESATE